MKNALALVLLLLGAAGGFGAASPPARPQRISILGKEYQRLDEWARANGFQWKWISKTEALAWKGETQMQFTTDAKKMSLKGVTVWLSEPVANQNNIPCISSLDFTSAIQPVLFPAKNRARNFIRHICIDPGHGGKDPGEHVGSEQEKKYTLLLAQELGAQLRKAGFTVSFTRTADNFIELPARPDYARKRGADLFLCLHFNAFHDREVHGAETYCLTPQRASSTNARGEGADAGGSIGNLNNARNMLLAYEIQRSLVPGAGVEDRGVKRARYAVLRTAEMPAVLIEGGFMTNPAEGKKIYSAAWRQKLAQSIVSGVQSYRKIVEP